MNETDVVFKMKSMTIDQIKQELKKRGLDATDVLDFSTSEFHKEFQRIIDFYNVTIDNHSIYNIRKSIFYVKNDTKVLNAVASAYKKLDFNTISITGRFVMFLIETFVEQHEEMNKQIDLVVSSDTIFLEEKFYFQYISVSHFVIYHELAHLIQFGSEAINYVEEFSSNKDEYKHEKHIFELDADEFAALSLGTHLIQYFEQVKKVKNELSLTNIADYASVSLGAIFIVMVNLHDDFDQFYIEKRSHPHPITRLILLSLTMIEYLNQTYIIAHYEKEKLDAKKIIDKSINYAHSYNIKVKGNPALEKVPSIVRNEIESIMSYIAKIRKDAEVMGNLAVKAWNDRIFK